MSGEALTARELDLLRELAGGSSREGIAKSRFISVNTLKAHLRSIYRKLGVGSRAAAVLEAERRGIL
nr:LuxR C-terminal-related transcriptional regulator [Leucobacter weissii]